MNAQETMMTRSKVLCTDHTYVHMYVTGFWKINHTYSILLLQLTATLIHYHCTVPLPGLANWSAFLDRIEATCKVTAKTVGPIEDTKSNGRYGSAIDTYASETSIRPSMVVWAYS